MQHLKAVDSDEANDIPRFLGKQNSIIWVRADGSYSFCERGVVCRVPQLRHEWSDFRYIGGCEAPDSHVQPNG